MNKRKGWYFSILCQLDECLEKYPKYYEAYIYRGKLYLKTKNYKKALGDF